MPRGTEDYQGELETAIEAAREAGELLRREFHRPGGPRGTPGKAPADEEAEHLIRRRLLASHPGYSYLGEETGSQRGASGEEHCWVVDPNDGTALFQKGQRGSAVSIALLRDGVPVLGVVFAFAAPDDGGDLFAWAEGGPPRRNGVELAAPATGSLDPYSVVLFSPGAQWAAGANLRAIAPARFRVMPSIAYRLALAAGGEGLAVSLHSPGGWDYGGGHGLLRSVGWDLVNEDGAPVRYSPWGESSTLCCFGGPASLAGELAARDWSPIRHARREPALDYELLRLEKGRSVSHSGMLSRAQGCLLGQLAGDSLGSLVEFSSPQQIRDEYPGGVRELRNGGVWRTLAGQPTDDSELALLLARSIVQSAGYDPDAAAQGYLYWLRTEPFDIGNTIGAALRGAGRGPFPPREAAASLHRAASTTSQANGALMRVSPLAVYGALARPEQVGGWARADAALTHPNPACLDANAVYAVTVAQAVRSGGSPRDVYQFAVDWANANKVDAAVRHALGQAAVAPPECAGAVPGWVLVALQNAFFQLLHARNLEEGVVQSVLAGGDTDTNAAIAGALLGAVHGRADVPFQWRQMILSCRPLAGIPGVDRPRPRSLWPVDALELAERLLLAGRDAAEAGGRG